MSISSWAWRTSWTIAAAAILVVGAQSPSHAAGLFDYLFGGFSTPAPRYDYDLPLGVRVNPERRKRASAPRAEPKTKLQTAIDPFKNPSWYLDDPTLRKGDVVILKGRALVYDGGRGTRTIDDFTPVQRSTMISKNERETIDRMSKGNAGATGSVDTAVPTTGSPKGKEAALR